MVNCRGMPPCFVSDLQPLLLLLFITAICSVAYAATLRPNYALKPSLLTTDQLLEMLLIYIFFLQDFKSWLVIRFLINGDVTDDCKMENTV